MRESIDKRPKPLRGPVCLLAVGGPARSVAGAVRPSSWREIVVVVDGVETGGVLSPPGRLWFVTGVAPGRREFQVKTTMGSSVRGGPDVVEVSQPVVLELSPGTIVLAEVRCRGRDAPAGQLGSARFQVLRSGFAHSGAWGRGWARRLGWAT